MVFCVAKTKKHTVHFFFGFGGDVTKTCFACAFSTQTPTYHFRGHQDHLFLESGMTKYTSPTKKARICRDKAAGLSNTAVAKKFGIHRTTVKRIFDCYAKSEDYYTLKNKSGRPRQFTAKDTRHAVQLLNQGKAHDASDLQRKYFPEINVQTIRTRLQESGLKAYVRRPKPFLSKTHQEK